MNHSSAAPGKFISFEGIDGAGKSTHIAFVARFPQVARQVGGGLARAGRHGSVGEKLRDMLLHEKMHLETEALADVRQPPRAHLAQVIEPALARGEWVISDRFTDASFAYQGGGRGLDARQDGGARAVGAPASCSRTLTLLFDVPLDVARARLDATRTLDKFEQEQADFLRRLPQ